MAERELIRMQSKRRVHVRARLDGTEIDLLVSRLRDREVDALGLESSLMYLRLQRERCWTVAQRRQYRQPALKNAAFWDLVPETLELDALNSAELSPTEGNYCNPKSLCM